MLPKYAGKVNCIYIDPPYNTGNEGWVYNDNVKAPLLSDWYADESPVDGEDLERHDKWLCMMWPRLQLLRELLADDGIICISIDHNEDHHLRLLMNEIFGEHEHRNTFVVSRVKKNIRETTRIRALNLGYNSIHLYGKSEAAKIMPPTIFDPKPARWHAFDAPGIRPNMEYELFGRKPPQGRHWMYTEDRARQMIEAGQLRSNPKSGAPQYRLDQSDHTMLDSNWTDLQEYDTQFNFPNGEKNVALIERIISMTGRRDAVVLDSFAGSGTTAHATLKLNAEDDGNRRFILVELEDYADSITAGRVRRVIKGVPEAKNAQLREGLGGSFTYCTLGEPLDFETMLRGDSLPAYAELAVYLLYTATGISVDWTTLESREDGWFFGDENTDYYLFYEPDIEWLQSNEAVFTEDQAKQIRAANPGRGAIVFAAGKFIGQRELSKMNINFCQLPYELHRAGG